MLAERLVECFAIIVGRKLLATYADVRSNC